MGITNAGYELRTTEEYFSDVISSLREHFPVNENDYANLMVVLARIIAENENRRDNEVAELYNNVYASTATGTSLDRAVFAAGVFRKTGTKSSGVATFTRNPESQFIIIPSNSLLVSNNVYFVTTNTSAVMIASPDESIDISIQAVEVGANGNLAASSSLQSVQPIVGLSSISTIVGFSGGSNIESDFSLRERFYISMNANRNSSLPSIIGQVKEVDGVTLCYGIENLEDFEDASGLPPRSISIFVLGGNDKEVAERILTSRAGGIRPVGDIEFTDIVIGGREYYSAFNRPEAESVYYDVTVVVNKNIVPSNIGRIITDAIIKFGTNITLVRKHDLDADIAQAHESIIGVNSSLFGLSNPPTSSSDLYADVGAYFNTGDEYITIRLMLE